MAIQIKQRTLGTIRERDNQYIVRIQGQQSKTFASKAAAEAHLAKYGLKRYDVAVWSDGKLHYQTFDNKKKAEQFRDRSNVEAADGVYKPISRGKKKTTLKQYCEQWRKKALILEEELKPSTLAVRHYILDRHIIHGPVPQAPPYKEDDTRREFGDVALRAITSEDIGNFRTRLLKEGQSLVHVKKILNLLGNIFSDAVSDGYLKVSPMPAINRKKKAMKKEAEKARALTYSQAANLLAASESNPDLKLVVMLGLLAGLRRGEAFGLEFQDIDWDKNLLHVRRSLFFRYGKHHVIPAGEAKYQLSTPKTDNSRRTIDLSPKLKDALWERFMEYQMAGIPTGRIFQSKAVGAIHKEKDGTYRVVVRNRETRTFAREEEAVAYFHSDRTPIDPNNFERRIFSAAVERVMDQADKDEDEETYTAFDGLTLHHLRHTFASWKLSEGADLGYVSKQLGHARPSITLDRYGHVILKRRPQATALTDANLFGPPVEAKN